LTIDEPPLINTITHNGSYERCRPIHRRSSDCLRGTTSQRANIIVDTNIGNIDQLGSEHHHTREQRERSILLN